MFFFVIFLGQGLDDPDTGDVFPHHPYQPVGRLLHLGEKAGAPPGDQKDQQAHEGKKGQQHQCKHRVQGEGNENAAQKQNGRPETDALHHADDLMDVIGVRGHAGDEGGDGKAVDLCAGEPGDAGEQIVAEASGGFFGHSGGHAVGQDAGTPSHNGKHQHGRPPPEHQGQILLRNHYIDHVGQYPGQKQVHDGAGELEAEPQGDAARLGPQVVKDASQSASPLFRYEVVSYDLF